MTVSIDDDTLAMEYDLGEVECGGVTLRAWGAPVTFHELRITSS
jgi:hypothetical protein